MICYERQFPLNLLLLLCVWVCEQMAVGQNGMQIAMPMAIALMAPSLSHYTGVTWRGRQTEERAYSCWSIAKSKSIAIINMHGVQWSGPSRLGYIIAAITFIVILSTQNGRRHVRWTKHRRCLTFKCRLPLFPANCACPAASSIAAQRSGQLTAGD